MRGVLRPPMTRVTLAVLNSVDGERDTAGILGEPRSFCLVLWDSWAHERITTVAQDAWGSVGQCASPFFT
ncbi:hypothetical protein NDU88_000227 [Pleurodeles waltl]|uniref:Uncharacterized protein n=1 Tax=Pleurodeles waltl TaxID=8319 RepID=A0AAV7P7Q4_PLEWA|nr:hypothetical protein NDU88_000227 [Pleurodeles waltl]